MSKHNYSQYSNNKKRESVNEVETENNVFVAETPVEETVVAPVVETVIEPAPVVETPKTENKVKTAKGTVSNCSKLNVRAKADINADVVCVLDAASEVVVDIAGSNKEWVKVCTAAGFEGYCMRKFVTTNR